MNIYSLKGQILAVLMGFAIALSVQLLLSRSNLSEFGLNQDRVVASFNDVTLVYEIERDIIDLQRSVLIYKETASDLAETRFHTLIQQVYLNLTHLEKNLLNTSGSDENLDDLSSMLKHLKDYDANFNKVIEGRLKRSSILDEKIAPILARLENQFNQALVGKISEKEQLSVQFHFSKVQDLIAKQVIKHDFNNSALVRSEIRKIKSILGKNGAIDADLNRDLKDLERYFLRLVNLTRGYLFLVNVVMVGSANEFLFLSKKVREEVIVFNQRVSEFSEKSERSIKNNNDIMAIISIVLCVIVVYFIVYRVINPIQSLTKVFKELASGNEIQEIPGIDRRDEIGDLTSAANVFRDKNEQTQNLLKSSQEMIAHQEKLNIQLDEQKQKAENAANTKSLFLANMSHEIRTPMNGIIGLVDMMQKTQLDARQHNYLDRIAYSGQVMMNVINDILDFSKIEAGKLDIEEVEFSIDTVIDNLLSAISVRAYEKGLSINLEFSQNIPETLLGDPLRISQILLNLCSNAIKFTEKGGVTIELDFINKDQEDYLSLKVIDTGIGMSQSQLDKVFTSFSQADDSISRKFGGTGLGLAIVKRLSELMGGEVSVKTEIGKGSEFSALVRCQGDRNHPALSAIDLPDVSIPYINVNHSQLDRDSILSHLSLPLTVINWDNLVDQADEYPKVLLTCNNLEDLKRYQSLLLSYSEHGGLPLFLVPRHDQDLNHYIHDYWPDSIMGLPCSASNIKAFFKQHFDEAFHRDNGALDESNIQFSGKVLLVEDNKINQLVAGDMLESLNVDYDLAENGHEAVDYILNKDNHVDLVLMDVQMPIMDGYSATRAIREAGVNDLIICGLSANALNEDVEKAMAAGMNDYMTKPLELDRMVGKFKKYLKVAS